MTELLTNRQVAEALFNGDRLEVKCANGSFNACYSSIIDFTKPDDPTYYRLAPTTITRTVAYPKPVTEPLNVGDEYYVPMPKDSKFRIECEWDNDSHDNLWLSRGLIYLTEADAIARAKAMIGGVE